jgi:hypothetical protein
MRDSSRLLAVRFSVVLRLLQASCVLPAAAQLVVINGPRALQLGRKGSSKNRGLPRVSMGRPE